MGEPSRGHCNACTVIPTHECTRSLIRIRTYEEKQTAELINAKLMIKPKLTQIEINKVEIGYCSIFVAG